MILITSLIVALIASAAIYRDLKDLDNFGNGAWLMFSILAGLVVGGGVYFLLWVFLR